MTVLWKSCLEKLAKEISDQQFQTFVKPLHAKIEGNDLILLAPNHFVKNWIKDGFLRRIEHLASEITGTSINILIDVGSNESTKKKATDTSLQVQEFYKKSRNDKEEEAPSTYHRSRLNPIFTFENFVEGKSNQFAKAACYQVAENPGKSYNPLFLYGGVGLGKTHLIHAVGNFITNKSPKTKIIYSNSERFVADMVKALQNNSMNSFKSFYSSGVLLIDDIQFLAGKERSQEEFFHVFNTLFEDQQQIILTSDCYPKEINKLEARLKSRFCWGLSVLIEPPELETRVAIINRKAIQTNVEISNEVAFFIAKKAPSNVRELEGALKRVIANSIFTGKLITVEFARETLKDLISLQDKLVTIENIIKTVAEYYKIKSVDLLSNNRSRKFTRPRQMAMALAKELTSRSLPEIGAAVGNRDHTTVLHACRKIKELIANDQNMKTEYTNLLGILSS
jgi:chromosomal replication initiator protein